MIVARRRDEVRAWGAALRRTGARVALVPTMGALHAGHLAHVQTARREADAVALSVFVNPTQFGPGEDWERYPRDLPRDIAMAREAGVDLIFTPAVEEMYPELPPPVGVDVGRLGEVLEGAVRPGHFRGVATVVAKLLHLFQPSLVTFGQKDAQQLVVVRRMLQAMDWGVRLRTIPTVRAADGLALSSRNAYLNPEERQAAPVLYRALQAALRRLQAGERSAAAVQGVLREAIAAEPRVQLDYAVVVDAAQLQPPADPLAGRLLLLVAARLGHTRLLDNVCVEVTESGAQEVLL